MESGYLAVMFVRVASTTRAEAWRVHLHFSALRKMDEIHLIEIITRCIGCNWPSFHFGCYQGIELQTLYWRLTYWHGVVTKSKDNEGEYKNVIYQHYFLFTISSRLAGCISRGNYGKYNSTS